MQKYDFIVPVILSLGIVGSLLFAIAGLVHLDAADKRSNRANLEDTVEMVSSNGNEEASYSTKPLFKSEQALNVKPKRHQQLTSRRDTQANYNMLSFIANESMSKVYEIEKSNRDNYDPSRKAPSQKKISASQKSICRYWADKHSQENSSYNRSMMIEACGDANTRIIYKKSPSQNVVINNNIHFANTNRARLASSCHNLNQCSQYQKRLELAEKVMRNGYKAHEYNRLESERKFWWKKLADHCACHPTNSF